MKMSKILALILALVMVVSCFAACGGNQGGGNQGGGNQGGTGDGGNGDGTNPLAGTYDITVWASDIPGVTDQFAAQIEAFEAANPGIIINATVSPMSEGSAGSNAAADAATAPDIYCFAQDQLVNLVQAGALAPVKGDVADAIRNNNDAGSVSAASHAGTLYAYPLTSDNGYVMFYDTSIISEEDAKDLATVVKRCEDAGLKFRFEVENGWYVASFFFGAGCHSQWTTNADGSWSSVDDNFKSDAGLKAMKAMQIVTHSEAYVSDANSLVDAGVIITGTWNANAAKEHFVTEEDGKIVSTFGVTKLPSVTVDGETFQLGSYHGYKLLGVKPQTDTKRSAVLQLLAQYLTGEECQTQRFESFSWGPSNKTAAANEKILNDPTIAAINAQKEHAVLQGQINGSWWDLAAALGTASREAASGDVEALNAALKTYDDAINAILQKSEEELKAWAVIGSICNTSWDTDFPMTEISDGVYQSAPLELKAGDEFKVRQGGSWDVNYGNDGNLNGPNCVVDADGTYVITLTIVGAKGTITWELAE